jgi:hypothetical protein
MDTTRDDEPQQSHVLELTEQKSPWEIGCAFYDQRDLFTQDARIDAAGYGKGPSSHPEEGSYAYVREVHPPERPSRPGGDLYEREAWPWLNYFGPDADPYFAFLRPRSRLFAAPRARAALARVGERVKERISALRLADPWRSVDRRLRRQVGLAIASAPELDASDIEVSVRWGLVRLDGTVDDRRSRNLAESVAAGVPGVRLVQNRLTIRRDDPRAPTAVLALPIIAL